MSLLNKKWIVKNHDDKLNVIAKLLQNRGIDTPEKAQLFFSGKLSDLHSPGLLKDMVKAVERIVRAVRGHEKIMVFGDYDVDGITATAMLYDFLKTIGADVHYTLPHREDDGYGLKDYFIQEFHKNSIQLIITVDCGTANEKEIALANELKIDVVITDHHSMPAKLPNAVAIVNPKRPDCVYPNKEICGSSIAYKLISSLAAELMDKPEAEAFLQKQLGVVALGVVGDCMAMTGENRILVKEGIKSLMAGDHAGVSALLAEAGIDLNKINSGVLAFQITPRINAAGRMDKADHSFELLLGKLEKAVTLNELNEDRKALAKEYVTEAKLQLKDKETPNIIVVHSKKWRAGLLGLVASALVERFGRPTIAMQERENEYVASMRSINDFDITGHLRSYASHLFTAFGGHTMAGGFSLPKENFEEFMKQVDEIAKTHVLSNHFGGSINIDCIIEPHEINLDTAHKLRHLEPFGPENREPILLLKNVRLLDIKPVGQKQEHLQIPLQYGDKNLRAIAFKFGEHLKNIDTLVPHDMVVHLETNEWNGQERLQLRVVDMKPTENNERTM